MSPSLPDYPRTDPPTVPPPSPLPGAVAQRYDVERELGHGASAIVYLAHDTVHDRPVALKALREELVESVSAERFLREIRQTARLQHPRIVSVLDDGVLEDGRPYFVATYMDGGTLRQRLARERQLPIGAAVAIAHAVATALDYAHRAGVIHRDVKPENILFSDDETCLGDFGIARALDAGVGGATTTTGVIRGTPAYMSPEQASGEREIDGRSDVYALGLVLYEILAGVLPFQGATAQAVIVQRFLGPAESVRRYRGAVPEALAEVVARALEVTPADRWGSAREFADALAGTGVMHTTDGGVPVRPPWWRRLSKWLGNRPRRRGRLAVAGATFALASALGAGAWMMYERGEEPGAGGIEPWHGAPLDTTRVLVLPVEVEGAPAAARARYGALLSDAIDRWDSVSVVDPFQRQRALGTDTARALTGAEAAGAARRALVGRYIRASFATDGDSVRVEGALYDAYTGTALHQRAERASTAGLSSAVARLADSLLLRGARIVPESVGGGNAPATTSLPAAQATGRALAALDDWDLPAVDSALGEALRFDRRYARAAYWQAQARAWQDLRAERWAALADQAVADSAQLAPVERTRAAALAALGRRDFDGACEAYDAMRKAEPGSFAGWFGYAQCHDMDHAVIRDLTSASGWRFRRSYEQAVRGYVRALTLLPIAHRGFQRGAYALLREKLYTNPSRLRRGQAVDGRTGRTSRFYARLGLSSDTLVFIPFLEQEVSGASRAATPRSLAAAISHTRRLFSDIANAWAARLPKSPGVKEAVATALEMAGDPSAADSLGAARALTADSFQRTRLAVSETLVRVKFSMPNRTDQLRRALRSADSLLAAVRLTDAAAELMAPLAALTRRCALADTLAHSTTRAGSEETIPGGVLADARAMETTAAAGCAGSGGSALQELADRLPREASGQVDAGVAYTLLNRAVALTWPPDSLWVARLSATSNDYLLTAQLGLLTRDPEKARRTLVELRSRRQARGASPTLDAAVPEARIWVSLGDTAAATEVLRNALAGLRSGPPGELTDPPTAASVPTAIELWACISGASAPNRELDAWTRTLDDLVGRVHDRPPGRRRECEALAFPGVPGPR